MAEDLISFGAWVRLRRQALVLTQADLAARVGVAAITIQKIEADERKPSPQVAELLAQQLGLADDVHALFVQVARGVVPVKRLPPAIPGANTSVLLAVTPAAPALPRGTVTFLFTDIEGSTRVWEQQPEAMRQALAHHDAILRAAIESHEGHVFKTMGDAFCAAFAATPDALAAAIAGQQVLIAEDWGAISPLRVRMALHTGTAEPQAGDYFGQPLNRVVRLLAAGHGGQILLSAASMELVRDHLPDGASLRELGVHRLKDLMRPEPLFQVCVPDLPTDFPPLMSLDVRTTNLPIQVNELIGRTREVAEVIDLLDRARLVTLTGPGGTGKTRLALQAAMALSEVFPDGVWFVDLSPVGNPTQVAATIAQVLGIPQLPDVLPRDQVITRLRQERTLLLVDNCEQVVEAAAVLVGDLLRAAPGVRVLVTSRVPLRIQGEREIAVGPLQLPDLHALPAAEHVSQYTAVQLFIERAQAVRADFAVTNANASAVAEICVRLDGLPLAIELAAARVKLFRPGQLLERLQRAALPTLTGGARDLSARQQTIRSTIDWSYRLLGSDEQALLARLGVFVGGWTLDAAQAVCGIAMVDVTEGLAALVAHSLVRTIETDTTTRYTMLETIREFALERLQERDEEMVLRDRHTMFFIQLAETAEPKLRSAAQLEWKALLDAEYDNLHAVLTWCLASSDIDVSRQARGLQLAVLLWYFWLLTNRGGMALAWLNVPWVNNLALSVALRARMLVVSELIHGWLGSLRFYLRYLMPEGLALVRSSGDRSTIALALSELALTKTDFVLEQAITYATEAQVLAIELGDRWLLAYAKLGLGAALNYAEQKRYEALQQLRAGLALVQQTGDRWLEAYAHWAIGLVLLQLPDYAEARAAFEHQVACYNELGDSALGKEFAVWGLGAAAEGAGLIDLARDYQVERAHYALLATNHSGMVATLVDSAIFAIEQGEYTVAADELRRSRAILMQIEPTHRQYFSIVLNLVFSCWEHVWLACDQGDFIRAQQEVTQFDHYVELARAAPFQKDDVQRLQYLDGARALLYGFHAFVVGDLALAQEHIDASLAVVPDDVRTLILAGRVAFHQGDYTSANKLFAQALSTNEARTWPFILPLTLIAVDQGKVYAAAGDIDRSMERYRTCLPFLQRGRLRPWIAKVFEGCAALATLQPNAMHAARFWGAAEALREQIGAPMWPVDRSEYELRVAEAKAQANPKEWETAWKAGRTLTWEQAVHEALAWLQESHEPAS